MRRHGAERVGGVRAWVRLCAAAHVLILGSCAAPQTTERDRTETDAPPEEQRGTDGARANQPLSIGDEGAEPGAQGEHLQVAPVEQPGQIAPARAAPGERPEAWLPEWWASRGESVRWEDGDVVAFAMAEEATVFDARNAALARAESRLREATGEGARGVPRVDAVRLADGTHRAFVRVGRPDESAAQLGLDTVSTRPAWWTGRTEVTGLRIASSAASSAHTVGAARSAALAEATRAIEDASGAAPRTIVIEREAMEVMPDGRVRVWLRASAERPRREGVGGA